MFTRELRYPFLVFVLALLTHSATAQVMSVPSSGFGDIGVSGLGSSSGGTAMGLISSEQMGNNLWSLVNEGQNRSPLESPSGSVSKLDLKAPGKARREYERGYKLLMLKDYKGAAEHLGIHALREKQAPCQRVAVSTIALEPLGREADR